MNKSMAVVILVTLLLAVSIGPVLAQTTSPATPLDTFSALILPLVASIVSFIVGFLLKRGASVLVDLQKLLVTYEQLGIIAVAVVTLIERKYAECDGPIQFRKACTEMSKWSNGVLSPTQIEELVETAYGVAKKLFLTEWEKLRVVNDVDVRQPLDSDG